MYIHNIYIYTYRSVYIYICIYVCVFILRESFSHQWIIRIGGDYFPPDLKPHMKRQVAVSKKS